jgi:alpha-galactosidase
LTGLDADALYQVHLANRHEAHRLSRSAMALKEGPLTLSGAYLMRHGLTLPWSFPERMWVVEGSRL